jgi:hypothetical protein
MNKQDTNVVEIGVCIAKNWINEVLQRTEVDAYILSTVMYVGVSNIYEAQLVIKCHGSNANRLEAVHAAERCYKSHNCKKIFCHTSVSENDTEQHDSVRVPALFRGLDGANNRCTREIAH